MKDITNLDIIKYLNENLCDGNENIGEIPIEEFPIKFVDKVRPNENALMFINNINYLDVIESCNQCLILISPTSPALKENLHAGSNNLFYIRNPKYYFCRVVKFFELPSRFDREMLPYIIYGKNNVIDDSAIIGGEDFSPVLTPDKNLIQFPQFGGVKLGDDVVIKYNSMIGRGTFDYTEIGDNTMIDYNVQVGHNCKVGKRCIITAGTIIGGSTTIGDDVVIGIGSMIRNNIKIGNNVSIGMGSVVTKDIPDNAVVVGNPARIIDHKHIFDEKGLL